MVQLLLVLVLFPGCASIGLADRSTGQQANTRVAGNSDEPAVREPLQLQLQLAILSDSLVTHLLQLTEAPLLAAKDASGRKKLLTLRLYYASVLWNAPSGPNPQANAIDMLVTFVVGQKVLEESEIAGALGSALQPTRDLLASAERDIENLVARFLDAAEYQALREAIAEQASSSLKGLPMESIDRGSWLPPPPPNPAANRGTCWASSAWTRSPAWIPRRARSPRLGSSATTVVHAPAPTIPSPSQWRDARERRRPRPGGGAPDREPGARQRWDRPDGRDGLGFARPPEGGAEHRTRPCGRRGA